MSTLIEDGDNLPVPLERIFGASGVGGTGSARFRADGDFEEEYAQRVNELIIDSVDFEESYLAEWREENQAYYNGLQPTLSSAEDGEEEPAINRSTFVSTDVRDTILTIMPSLMRIFTNTDQKVAEFIPTTEEHEPLAEQAYDFINYVFFTDNPGFLILHAVFKDALTVKSGITKWWTDTDYEVKEQTFHNVSQEQYQLLLYEMPDVEVVELGEMTEEGIISKVTLRHAVSKPIQKVAAVPPDEFRISKNAKDIENSPLVGHERDVPISELVAKGYDLEELRDHLSSGQPNYSDERFFRNPALVDHDVNDEVLYGEWFIRVDKDGDGIDELRHICTVGQNRTIVSDDVVPYTRFALWGVDPKPHTAIGDCLADITKDIQRIKSFMIRGQLDNLAESLHPRTVVNELLVNIEDVLNDEVGAVIRTRGDPQATVAYTRMPYNGADVQESVNYLDQVRASRTGISEASKGLDPDAMQSTALVGINAIISGAQERIELIARILAETGLRPTLEGLLREAVNNPNPRRLKMRGSWKDINPSLYDPTMRVQVNPTLGKGTDAVRLQALGKVEQTQMLILEKFGIANPIVTPQEFLNTQIDIMAIANIKNPSRYFRAITPEIAAAISQAPKEPDPGTLLAQAELEKVKKDVIVAQGDQAIKQGNLQLKAATEANDMDYKRDKLNLDTTVKLLDVVGTMIDQFQVPEGVKSENQPG